MSNESDGEEGAGDGVVTEKATMPKTRPSQAPGAALGAGPAVRPSASLLAEPEVFPDDGALAGALRRVDTYAGQVEQFALFGLLLVIITIGVVQAIATKAFNHSFLWSFDAVRAGTFAIAMAGAAFASHQARHLSMDLISRKVSPRTRLILRVVLALFTVFATSLLFYSGYHLTDRLWNEAGGHSIPPHLVALMIPVGCALIIFHTVMRMLIDVDYLRRGKLPPEKVPTGH